MAEATGHCVPSPRVLVVDDNSTNRLKMCMAVRNLAYDVDMAEDGAAALHAVRDARHDALLLDIVMPDLDGFAVLREMKADPDLRDIPVIVISSLEDETASVVKAIELGAEDFLPKDFDPILLKARLGACLEKKRFRDAEREDMRRVATLTEAAKRVERGRFSPEGLGLDEIAAREDPLGHLAAVFRGMAEEIYQRELRIRQAFATLQGGVLVVAVGLVWGLTPALARMASGIGSNPVGLAVWVNGIAAVCCLSVSAFRGTLPKLNRQEFLFFLQWAIVAGVLLRLQIFWVTGHVEATMLSLIVTLEGLMVFALAAVMRLERASPRRLLGMLISIAGVCGAVLARAEFATSSSIGWILVSLLVPLLFGVQGLLIASRRPERIDIFAAGGIMMLISASLLFPIAFLSGQLLPLGPAIGRLEIVVALMGIGAAASLLLIFHLTATTGAVFASLNSYSCSLAGIFWGVLLLGEQMSAAAWLATCAVFIGLYLVGPKLSDDELVLDRSFSSRVPSEST